jgi:hypothetical protein
MSAVCVCASVRGMCYMRLALSFVTFSDKESSLSRNFCVGSSICWVGVDCALGHETVTIITCTCSWYSELEQVLQVEQDLGHSSTWRRRSPRRLCVPLPRLLHSLSLRLMDALVAALSMVA